MNISICSVTYCYSLPHVSVSAVTIIRVAYNNNTVNIQIIVQKCMIKPPGLTLDFSVAVFTVVNTTTHNYTLHKTTHNYTLHTTTHYTQLHTTTHYTQLHTTHNYT